MLIFGEINKMRPIHLNLNLNLRFKCSNGELLRAKGEAVQSSRSRHFFLAVQCCCQQPRSTDVATAATALNLAHAQF